MFVNLNCINWSHVVPIKVLWFILQQQGQHNIIGDAQNALGQDDGHAGTVQLG